MRIELMGNEIESLREFDPATQRSVRRIEDVELGPAREFTADVRDRLDELDLDHLSREARERFEEELAHLRSGQSFAASSSMCPFSHTRRYSTTAAPETLLIVDEWSTSKQ